MGKEASVWVIYYCKKTNQPKPQHLEVPDCFLSSTSSHRQEKEEALQSHKNGATGVLLPVCLPRSHRKT